MSPAALSIGVPLGAYAERADAKRGWLDRVYSASTRRLLQLAWRHPSRRRRLVRLVSSAGAGLRALDDEELRNAAATQRADLRRTGFREDVAARTFAIIREIAERTIGMRHFDVQVYGGWILLEGMMAEMETGEGKTLTITLPACVAALAGYPVHVITVNEYLARRDAEAMGPIYGFLGLTVGVAVEGMSLEDRRAAYACNVTYCTNKQLVFDFLRDRLVLGTDRNRARLMLERLHSPQPRQEQLLLRGLCFGIVDEADSVLVDEARTPLIISNPSKGVAEGRTIEAAHALAQAMVRNEHFVIDTHDRAIRLTPRGEEWLEEETRSLGGVWDNAVMRQELLRNTLTANHLLVRDRHYLVKDGKVQIIDEYTGRVMADRSWERGLHQALEVKEGCELTMRTEPLARISFQRFFRRYIRLAGLTGTASEVAGEMRDVYGMPVVVVPTNRPLRRTFAARRTFKTSGEKWRAVVERIRDIHATGRPVLVGTRSVEASEHLGRLLAAADLPHQVLNARQTEDEAEIIARAGQPARITVATNMAGRGTDIRLAEGIAELGGLHVIATEHHEARRIDRQLFGRCGRQGDPGSYEILASLDDELVEVHGEGLLSKLAMPLARSESWCARFVRDRLLRRHQRAAERKFTRIRYDLLNYDETYETRLAFSGLGE